jgi:hypothetical protein
MSDEEWRADIKGSIEKNPEKGNGQGARFIGKEDA